MKRERNNSNKAERAKGLKAGELLLLIANFLWMAALYYGCVYVSERTGSMVLYQVCAIVYVVAAVVLPFLSGVLSGKFVSEKQGEERSERQLAMSRRLLLLAIPLISVLLIDFIDLFVVEYLRQLLNSVA
ncbi:MAG: hypothetical protein IJD22_06015 [Clostridia bacterium]|nr:hypothetical protein [Clostridia bacterium]